MIEVSHVTKKYGNIVAVDDLSFSVKSGEILGFLGPNGAGKSPTMNMLTGYISSTAGSLTIGGIDILEDPVQAKKLIGYLPEHPPLYPDMTVQEYLYFMYSLKGVRIPREPHITEICELCRIKDVYKRLIRNLSKGYKQRVGIAQALLGNPPVLILDEPTVGLDPSQIIEIRSLIKALGKHHTVILSSHILSEVQAVCERIIVINKGKLIADGSPESLSRSISKDHRLLVRIKGAQKDVNSALSSIPGVKAIKCLGVKEPGTVDFTLDPEEGTDIRPLVFERLVSRKLPVYGMRSLEMSLEDLFIRLTGGDDSVIEDLKKGGKS